MRNRSKKLRPAATGVGIMDCKQALQGVRRQRRRGRWKVLRKMGKAKVAKKAGREASEGRIETYVHLGGKIAVMIELNSETDFVAKSEEFIQLARDIAMHIAAASPRFIRREDVDEAALDEEREIYRSQAEGHGQAGRDHRQDRRRQGRALPVRGRSCTSRRSSRIPIRSIGGSHRRGSPPPR